MGYSPRGGKESDMTETARPAHTAAGMQQLLVGDVRENSTHTHRGFGVQNIHTYGKMDFADVIKVRILRKLFWITWMCTQYSHKCLYKSDLV